MINDKTKANIQSMREWDRIAPKHILDLVSNQLARTITSEGGRLLNETDDDMTRRLDKMMFVGYVKASIVVIGLVSAMVVGGMAFKELTVKANIINSLVRGE